MLDNNLGYWISFVYDFIIISPMRRLYMSGPEWSNLGGWGGKPNAQICGIMTDTDPKIWTIQNIACDDLIERRFTSIFILYVTFIYMFILCKLTYDFINYFFYLRPVLNQIDRMQLLVENTIKEYQLAKKK